MKKFFLALCAATTVSCNPPTILQHPESQTVIEGDSVTFYVSASTNSGGDLHYAWQFNEENIQGAANASSYTISKAEALKHSGSYRVAVANEEGIVFSNPALLIVEPKQEDTQDLTGPEITLLEPINKAVSVDVSIKVEAFDKNGIREVKLFKESTRIAAVSKQEPYTFTLFEEQKLLLAGKENVELRILAYDKLGNESQYPLVLSFSGDSEPRTPTKPNPNDPDVIIGEEEILRERYVDINKGEDSASNGAITKPFRTLQYAMQQLMPGDRLNLREGVYSAYGAVNSNKLKHGTATYPIIVRAYPGERASLSKRGTENRVFGIRDIRHWIFEGLIFERYRGIHLGAEDPNTDKCVNFAEHITFRNNRFQHTLSGYLNGIQLNCSKNIKIINNVFDNIRGREPGIETSGIVGHYAENVMIKGNLFSDISGDGVILNGSMIKNVTIEDNEFKVIRPYKCRDIYGNEIKPGESGYIANVGENAIDVKWNHGNLLIQRNIAHGFRPTVQNQDASGSNGVAMTFHEHVNGGVTVKDNYYYDNNIHLSVGKGWKAPDGINERDIDIIGNTFGDVTYDKARKTDPGFQNSPTSIKLSEIKNIRILNNQFENNHEDDSFITLYLAQDIRVEGNTFNTGYFNFMTLINSPNISGDNNTYININHIPQILRGTNDSYE